MSKDNSLPSINTKDNTDLVNDYVTAATRDNTRRSYQSAVKHFELEWGGFLPASSKAIASYLAEYATKHSINTLKTRLSGLSQWHVAQGFEDPTKSLIVKKCLSGIQASHPKREKQAEPITIDVLEKVVASLDSLIEKNSVSKPQVALTATRNKALVLIGFWRGFRSDTIVRITVENTKLIGQEAIEFYIPQSKTDRNYEGETFTTPRLSRLCPALAYEDWINASGLTEGPVFRKIDRWGNISENALFHTSITSILRRELVAAGVNHHEYFSSHSFRRGFATWADQSGWQLNELMSYVGWKDSKSAMRYIDKSPSRFKNRIESSLLIE